MELISDKQWVETTKIYQDNPFKGLAVALHFSAMEGFHGFHELLDEEFSKNNQVASQHIANVYLEFLLLFLHLMNRKGDELFGKKYDLIQQKMLPYVALNAGSYFEGDKKHLIQLVIATANQTEYVYSKCKYWISPTEKNSIKAYADEKALVVEFHKRLMNALEMDSKDFMAKMEVMSHAAYGETMLFNLIKLDEWLKGPAMVLGIKNFQNIDLKPPGDK